ncbi:hypothetical protein [Synoicihabitans lomoniglobus]|uniref:Thioredoxin-like fold domain-containing protein n=1 Tax=Synoicihabitans lomoniglobus TaxID=2909285 RepID=A0AAF0CPF1_9BACT|nr:hypothetical protein [Opitutaceae bacterium LMO-M01]WED64414.1 hypothetical protein PXH66_18910 [Opitutaceae bacterium LMO-M01]
MKQVRFYHSAICPRCRLSGLWLARMLPDFPDVEIEKTEFLTHRLQAKADGVRGIPTLVADDQRLSGILLTRKRLRGFLESL